MKQRLYKVGSKVVTLDKLRKGDIFIDLDYKYQWRAVSNPKRDSKSKCWKIEVGKV